MGCFLPLTHSHRVSHLRILGEKIEPGRNRPRWVALTPVVGSKNRRYQKDDGLVGKGGESAFHPRISRTTIQPQPSKRQHKATDVGERRLRVVPPHDVLHAGHRGDVGRQGAEDVGARAVIPRPDLALESRASGERGLHFFVSVSAGPCGPHRIISHRHAQSRNNTSECDQIRQPNPVGTADEPVARPFPGSRTR